MRACSLYMSMCYFIILSRIKHPRQDCDIEPLASPFYSTEQETQAPQFVVPPSLLWVFEQLSVFGQLFHHQGLLNYFYF